MLDAVITSKTKIHIFVKLFLNPENSAYLRELAKEFGVSTNSVRTELNILTRNGILAARKRGRQILYSANRSHPLFPELASMVRKLTGIDSLVQSVIQRLGELEAAYLIGDYAKGMDSGIIDVILVGNVDPEQLQDIVRKTENYIKRKIRPLILTEQEFRNLREKGRFDPFMVLFKRN